MTNEVEPEEVRGVSVTASEVSNPLGLILDIPLSVQVVLSSTRMAIQDLLQLSQGSIIELEKLAGEPLDVLVNGNLVARGEAVIINEKFGVRILEVISRAERISTLAKVAE